MYILCLCRSQKCFNFFSPVTLGSTTYFTRAWRDDETSVKYKGLCNSELIKVRFLLCFHLFYNLFSCRGDTQNIQ